MAIGYLTIQVRTAHDALPLSDVHIRISDDMENIIYELTTDATGETQTVPLETMDKRFSQNQYFSSTPYINYSVLAQKSGFNSIIISEIPIFDGQTAVLPIVLVPIAERQQRPALTKISIGKPAVAMSNARNQQGSDASPYVLRQVVIPNPITVHLGRPDASASNIQVSFSDYVKNVASSEIYPTWPDAALRANIYAIITFALNRIYTEWYRNQWFHVLFYLHSFS